MAETNRNDYFKKAPKDQEIYTTLEFYHPDIGVLRYVTKQQFAKSFTLETDAPRNAGELVQFEAVAFEAPELDVGAEGELSQEIQLGSVGQMIKEKLNSITDDGWLEPLEVIRREYLSGVTYPEVVYRLETEIVGLETTAAGIKAGQVNFAGFNVSRIATPEDFPGEGLSR